jgi:hypothetical protein
MTTPSPASSSNVAIDEKHGLPSEEVKPPMAGLSEQEKEIIERQIDAPKLQISYFALFRYAKKNEVLIMVVALIASIAAGATMPLMTVCSIFIEIVNPSWDTGFDEMIRKCIPHSSHLICANPEVSFSVT